MATLQQVTHAQSVALSADGRSVVLLDQTLLPHRCVYLHLQSLSELHEAISSLRVRGAPAIGICAAYACYVLAAQIPSSGEAFYTALQAQAAYLDSARPTAVNLHWALTRMLACARAALPLGRAGCLAALKREACAIHEEDIAMCRAISEYGLSLLHPGDGVLTHCNAGPLATSRYGTGQGPLFLALEKGVPLKIFCDETRPLLQGARLTAYELSRAGADVTLICDNMASLVMKNGWVQACMVGCDRIAANGDTANKIGTSAVAVLARYYGIPFYVLGPTSTVDLRCATGDEIPIEERPPQEIREKFFAQSVALPTVNCYNPAFDVTDHSLITAIITERGICRPPYTQSLAALFAPTHPQGGCT